MNYFKSCPALAAALLLSTLTVSFQAHAQTREIEGNGQLLDRVTAVVNDGVVLESEVNEQMAAVQERLRGQGQQMPPESVLRQQIDDAALGLRLQGQLALGMLERRAEQCGKRKRLGKQPLDHRGIGVRREDRIKRRPLPGAAVPHSAGRPDCRGSPSRVPRRAPSA